MTVIIFIFVRYTRVENIKIKIERVSTVNKYLLRVCTRGFFLRSVNYPTPTECFDISYHCLNHFFFFLIFIPTKKLKFFQIKKKFFSVNKNFLYFYYYLMLSNKNASFCDVTVTRRNIMLMVV